MTVEGLSLLLKPMLFIGLSSDHCNCNPDRGRPPATDRSVPLSFPGCLQAPPASCKDDQGQGVSNPAPNGIAKPPKPLPAPIDFPPPGALQSPRPPQAQPVVPAAPEEGMGNCLATPQVADTARGRGWAANGGPPQSSGASAASAAAPAHSSKAMSAPGNMGAAAAAAAGMPHAHLRGGGAVSLPPAIAALAGSPRNSGVTPRADPVKLHQMKKRIAVAAEAITNAADVEVPVVPKTEFAERLIGGPAVRATLGQKHAPQRSSFRCSAWHDNPSLAPCSDAARVQLKAGPAVCCLPSSSVLMCPACLPACMPVASRCLQRRPSGATCCLSSCPCLPSRPSFAA